MEESSYILYVVLFLLGLQAVRHTQIMRRCGLEQVWCSNPVPTLDSGQSITRLCVPNLYYLSLMRRSKPAFQWQGTNERIHRQWQQGKKQTKDRQGGTNLKFGLSYLACDTRDLVIFRTPRETINQQRENSLLRVGLKISNPPFQKFSGFRNCGPESVTPSIGNTNVLRSEPLAHAGTYIIYPLIL